MSRIYPTTERERQQLVDHVGCGDVDNLVGCETCALIREHLRAVPLLPPTGARGTLVQAWVIHRLREIEKWLVSRPGKQHSDVVWVSALQKAAAALESAPPTWQPAEFGIGTLDVAEVRKAHEHWAAIASSPESDQRYVPHYRMYRDLCAYWLNTRVPAAPAADTAPVEEGK